MARKQTRGTCALCGKEFTRAGMTKHLQACLVEGPAAARKTQEAQPFYHVLVTGRYAKDYWLHLKVAGRTSLQTLDNFLRDIWLECCGHMSAFMHGGRELSMSQKISHTFTPGLELNYMYDFGSSTELQVKVIGSHEGQVAPRKPIEILARNEPPVIPCDECAKAPAEQICGMCQWEGGGWLCRTCAEKHDCEEDYFLPVVNSPRTGVCGYVG